MSKSSIQQDFAVSLVRMILFREGFYPYVDPVYPDRLLVRTPSNYKVRRQQLNVSFAVEVGMNRLPRLTKNSDIYRAQVSAEPGADKVIQLSPQLYAMLKHPHPDVKIIPLSRADR